MAVQQVTLMFTSMKGKPVQGRMYHGKEARQFVSIFQPMVILKVFSFALVVVMMYLCFDIIALEFEYLLTY